MVGKDSQKGNEKPPNSQPRSSSMTSPPAFRNNSSKPKPGDAPQKNAAGNTLMIPDSKKAKATLNPQTGKDVEQSAAGNTLVIPDSKKGKGTSNPQTGKDVEQSAAGNTLVIPDSKKRKATLYPQTGKDVEKSAAGNTLMIPDSQKRRGTLNPQTGKDVEQSADDNPETSLPIVATVKDKKTEDDKLDYDPEDDVWTLEEGEASVGRKYARSLMEGFRPVLYVAVALGLFPLVPRREKDGTYTIKFVWFSYATIMFLIVATLVLCTTSWICISIVCISMDVGAPPEHVRSIGKSRDDLRSEEVFVLKRNVVTLVLMITTFIHLTICMAAVFRKKDYIAKQLVYWTEVVELLRLDVGRHVAKRLWRQLVILMIFVTTIITLYILQISPGLAGSGSTFYVVLTQAFDPISHWHDSMSVRKVFCAIFLLYSMLAGYIYILWFFFNCRILTNILRIWNNRFQYCLHKQILELPNTRKSIARFGVRAYRTSRAQLFQDHLVIFNLLEGVNTQFEVIMESFYLSTMIMIVFEAYGFVHACVYSEYTECGARQQDAFPLLILLGLQIYLYIIVTLEAAGVADEARHVLDIVRRKGMMTSRVDNELWFMMSMRLSFGGHEDVGIIGAGFFYITKSFLLGAISAITSHLIIFYQFEIPYGQTVDADPLFAKLNVTELLVQLEGVPNTKC